MASRPRSAFKRATHSAMIAFSIAVGATSGQARSQQAPIAPQPFTALPVRALPTPAIRAEMPSSRALTTGEQKLLRTLFGDTAPISDLQLVFDTPDLHAANDNDTSANAVHLHDPRLFSKDYSAESDPYLFGYFVNQITGEMQKRMGDTWVADRSLTGSFYNIDGRAFHQYGPDQQRAIMEDYALRFLHSSRQSYWLSRMYNGDRSITDPYLITAVESAFPSAKKGRTDFAKIILRRLTPAEVKLIHKVFGDQFETENVWVHLSPTAYKDVAGAVASGREVYFYGRNRSNDFTQEDANAQGVFLHEMTHIWQFQTDRRFTVVVNDQYEYTIEANSRFEDFNIEQQAAMMEDYLLYCMNKDQKLRWLPQSYTKEQLAERTQFMLNTVEAFFPGARTLRNLPPLEKVPNAVMQETPLDAEATSAARTPDAPKPPTV